MRLLLKRMWTIFLILGLCASWVIQMTAKGEDERGKAVSAHFSMDFGIVDRTAEISCEVNNTDNLHGQNVVEYRTGYLHSDIDLKGLQETERETETAFGLNDEITYVDMGNGWYSVAYGDKSVYLEANMIYENPVPSIAYPIANSNGFKSFMPYKEGGDSIFVKSSNQYKLQQLSSTGKYGIRMYKNRFCVAIGTYFLNEKVNVGTYFDVVLKNGTVIPCVIGDIKDEKDTRADNITTACNGCVSEFIVDMTKISREVRLRGDVSFACEEWKSEVAEIVIYDMRVEL